MTNEKWGLSRDWDEYKQQKKKNTQENPTPIKLGAQTSSWMIREEKEMGNKERGEELKEEEEEGKGGVERKDECKRKGKVDPNPINTH